MCSIGLFAARSRASWGWTVRVSSKVFRVWHTQKKNPSRLALRDFLIIGLSYQAGIRNFCRSVTSGFLLVVIVLVVPVELHHLVVG